MKKLLITLTAMAISIPAFAQNLPFVGTKWFTFTDDAIGGIYHSIHIKANGDTTVHSNIMGMTSTDYQGKFQNPLPIEDENGKISIYFLIKDGKVHGLDGKKQPETGCDGVEGKPCVAILRSE